VDEIHITGSLKRMPASAIRICPSAEQQFHEVLPLLENRKREWRIALVVDGVEWGLVIEKFRRSLDIIQPNCKVQWRFPRIIGNGCV
jgi:hypothetical protein